MLINVFPHKNVYFYYAKTLILQARGQEGWQTLLHDQKVSEVHYVSM